MRDITIRFSRKLRNVFSRAAKEIFPKEAFAFCFGTHNKSTGIIEIIELYFPEIVQHKDGAGFSVMPAAQVLAEKLSEAAGLEILATCHSHPYKEKEGIDDCAPSETDWERLYPDLGLCMGICSVVQYNKKLHTRFRFWPTIKKIKLTC